MRLTALFLYCFVSMVAPVGLGLGLAALKEPQYGVSGAASLSPSGECTNVNGIFGPDAVQIVTAERLEDLSALNAVGAPFPDSTVVSLSVFQDPGAARTAATDLVDLIGPSSRTSGPSGTRYSRGDTDRRGLVRVFGAYLVWVEGPTREHIDRRFETLPVIERNPEQNLANVMLDDNVVLVVCAIVLWILLQVILWPRLASAAATARAPEDKRRRPESFEEVSARLAQLGSSDGPVRVVGSDRADEMLVEWQYDSGHWVSLMSAGNVKLLRRIRLRLDERLHRVLARDEQSDLTWEVGPTGAAGVGQMRWKAMRGIVFFQFERSTQAGLVFEDGRPRFGEHYTYEFDVRELRAPVLAILGAAGWDYRPVVAFNRMFAG